MSKPVMYISPPDEEMYKAVFDERSTHCIVEGRVRLSDGRFDGSLAFAGTEEECEEAQARLAGTWAIVHSGWEARVSLYEIDDFRTLLKETNDEQ